MRESGSGERCHSLWSKGRSLRSIAIIIISPPLVCIFGSARLYACISPVSCRYLTVSLVSRCISLYLAILHQIHCIPLYPTLYVYVYCIQLYPCVSSYIQLYLRCIPLHLIVSHLLENGIWPRILQGRAIIAHSMHIYI